MAYDDLAIRYWFTSEDNSDLNFWCDWAQLGTANVMGNFGQANSMDYLEVTFASNSGNLSANASSGNIQTRFTKTDWSNFNESDDYSFDPTKTNYTSHEQVTLYQNGALVWGIEPGSTKSISSNAIIIIIYPNPTAEYINIQDSKVSNGTLHIYDLTGKLLKELQINSRTDLLNIPISNYPSGAYIMELVSEKSKQTEVFIVK